MLCNMLIFFKRANNFNELTALIIRINSHLAYVKKLHKVIVLLEYVNL